VLLGLPGLAISLVVKPGWSRRSFTWVLPGVLILDLFSFGRDYNLFIPKQLEYPSHGAIDFLREQPGFFRILTLNGGFPPEHECVIRPLRSPGV